MPLIFEDFTLDLGRRELRRGKLLVAVQPQVFDLLVYIIKNHERVVTRDNLIEHIWNGRIVSESTLATRINAARKAIGDNGADQRLIRTARGKGIRFVGILTTDKSSDKVHKQSAINEKANLYLPPILCPTPDPLLERITDELEDILTATIASEPLHALILDAPPDTGSATGYSLSCVIRATDDQLNLSIKVTNVETSNLIWAEQYNIPIADYAIPLRHITDKITSRAIAVSQLDRSSRARAKDLDQASATDLYFKSRSLIRTKSPADNFAAEKLVRQSIELGPELFGGHMGLSLIYMVRTSSIWTEDIPRDIEIARKAANSAASANENSVGPLHMLAFIAAYKRQFSVAMEYVVDCEKLDNSRALNKGLRGVMLSFQGQFEEALVQLESGQRIDADQKKAYALNIGRTHFMSGNYDLAIPKLEKYVGQFPAGDLAQLFLGNCYDATGQQDKARDCVATQFSLCPHTTIERISHVTPYRRETLETFNAFLRKYGVPKH